MSSVSFNNDITETNHTQEYLQQRNQLLEKENYNQKVQISLYNSNITNYLLQNNLLHETLKQLQQYLDSLDGLNERVNEQNLQHIDSCQPLIAQIKQDMLNMINQHYSDSTLVDIQNVSQLQVDLQLSQIPDDTNQSLKNSLVSNHQLISLQSKDGEGRNIVNSLNNFNTLLTSRSIKLQEMHQKNNEERICFLLQSNEEKQNTINKQTIQIQVLDEKCSHYSQIIHQLGNQVENQYTQMKQYFNLIDNMNDSLSKKCLIIQVLVDQCNQQVVQNQLLSHEQKKHIASQINSCFLQIYHSMQQHSNEIIQRVNVVTSQIQNIPQKLLLVQQKYNKKNIIFNEFRQLNKLSDKIDNNLIQQLFEQYDDSLRDGISQFSFEIVQLSNNQSRLEKQIKMIQSQLNIALQQLSINSLLFQDIEYMSETDFCESVQQFFIKPLINYHTEKSRTELKISGLQGQIQTFQNNLINLVANLGLTLDITLQQLNESEAAQHLFTEIYEQIKTQLFEKQQEELMEMDEQAVIIKQFAEQIQTLRLENTKLIEDNYRLCNKQLRLQKIEKQFVCLKELVQNIRNQYCGYHQDSQQQLSNVKQQNQVLETKYNECLMQLFQLEQDKAMQVLLNEQLQEQLSATKFDLQDTDLQIQKLKQSCEELETYRQISGDALQRSKLANSQVRPSDLPKLSNEQYLQQICYLQQLVATKEAIIKDLKRYIYESEQISGDSQIANLKNTIRQQDDLIFELQNRLEATN